MVHQEALEPEPTRTDPEKTGASSADIADPTAARQEAERVRNWKRPDFRADPSHADSVPIDSLFDHM
jgi:hypothetical protein